MFESICVINGKIRVSFNRKEGERVAAYLYRRDECIEKIMYLDQDTVDFSHFMDEGVVYHVIGYIRKGLLKESEVERSNYFYHKNNILKILYKNILYESENILITLYDQGSDTTVVTFNGTRTTKKTKSFGLNFVIENSWNCICVHQDNDTQYQDLSEQLFYETIKGSLINKNVYTYGVSLGGYCAIYFGGIINAKIIAGSPKNSAHPHYLNDRFKGLVFKHQSITKTKKTERDVIILYDPFQLDDVKFIDNEVLNHYPYSFLLPLPKAGHRVLEPLVKHKLLKKMIISFIENEGVFFVINKVLREYHIVNR